MTTGEHWVSVDDLRHDDLFEWKQREYLVVMHDPGDDRIPIPTNEQLRDPEDDRTRKAIEMDPQEKTILARCIETGELVSLLFKGGLWTEAGEFQDGWPCVKLTRQGSAK